MHNLSDERLGNPTQKPPALLERIVAASSNKGDVVLDRFCGCGTALDAAQKLKHNWFGIDITHLAVSLIGKRLLDRYPELKSGRQATSASTSGTETFEIIGVPQDFAGARDLAERDKHQFPLWACFVCVALKDPGAAEDARHGHQRPKIEEFGSSLFAVLHNPSVEDGVLSVGEINIYLIG